MKRQSTIRRRRVPAPPVEVRFLPLLDADPDRSGKTFTVHATVWRYEGAGGWHFASLPEAMSAAIRKKFAGSKRGWGSIPVRVRIGDTQWDTSLFPSRKTKSYLFAIKQAVRQAEGIVDGSRITASLCIR